MTRDEMLKRLIDISGKAFSEVEAAENAFLDAIENHVADVRTSTAEECAQIAESEAQTAKANKRFKSNPSPLGEYHARIVAKHIRNRFGITPER